jgi:uncharacterized protein YndB with AHSA1/START domain
MLRTWTASSTRSPTPGAGSAAGQPAVTREEIPVTELTIIHDTFTIERTYAVPAGRVFAAFASREAKDAWAGDGEPTEPAPGSEFDFRVGGRERFAFAYQGTAYRYDACYYDIVPGQRIIYSYEMYADDARISVSVATVEFAATPEGTALSWTEQGAYLDGFDGPEAPRLREGGTAEMLDGLAKYLS